MLHLCQFVDFRHLNYCTFVTFNSSRLPQYSVVVQNVSDINVESVKRQCFVLLRCKAASLGTGMDLEYERLKNSRKMPIKWYQYFEYTRNSKDSWAIRLGTNIRNQKGTFLPKKQLSPWGYFFFSVRRIWMKPEWNQMPWHRIQP